MQLCFENLEPRYHAGMADFLAFHRMEQSSEGLRIRITANNRNALGISRNGNAVTFSLSRPHQVFRAVTLLKGLGEQAEYEETVYFDTCGAMFDGSQSSSLMNVKTCKKMMRILAGMGYNMMMLYCEDCYEVEGEPYFGNMRPRFSHADFRELDDYADSLGLELVPCIQTLGHLPEAIKRPPYHAMSDNDSVLLVGDERVYALIDKLIATVSRCFRSRRVHIGMDEAWNLGLGNYLHKHGYTPAPQIMAAHLARVAEITAKYGMKPMMWNDMFFRSKDPNGAYYQGRDFAFTPEDAAAVPKDFGLVYWDYYHDTPEVYTTMLRLSRQLSGNVIFAGCARNVFTFAGCYSKTEVTTNAGLAACKALGIRETFVTSWGDDHTESSNFTILPGLQLYAEHAYARVPDMDQVKRRLRQSANADWEDFMDIDALDNFAEHHTDRPWDFCLTRACMWQDVLLGLYDSDLGDGDYAGHFRRLKEKLEKSREKYPEYRYVFDFYTQVAKTLEIKSTAGRKLAAAYKAGDRGLLERYAGELLPEIMAQLQAMRLSHRDYFFTEFKPIGWETLDIRYGGAIMRIDTAIKRIRDYLDGTVDRIEELEEARLPYTQGGHPVKIFYNLVCSASGC